MRVLGLWLAAFTFLATVVANNGGKLPRVSHLFVDFDGTIAVSEAFENLAEAAYKGIRANSSIPPWTYFSDTYLADYDAFTTSFGPRPTLSRELAFQSSAGLRAVEAASFDRVTGAHAFSSARPTDLLAAASGVQLREGWWELVAYALSEGVRPQVISLNWSPQWIRLVLRTDAARAAAGSAPALRWLAEAVEIYCPEALPKHLVQPPNDRDRPVRLHTGGDKVQFVADVVRRRRDARAPPRSEVIFVGDSKADLPPLLKKPTIIGVVAKGSGSMAEALEKFGVEVRAVNNGTSPLRRTGEKEGLWELESFAELVGKFRGPKEGEW